MSFIVLMGTTKCTVNACSYKFENSSLYLITLYNEFSCIRKIVKDDNNYILHSDDNCISISSNNFKIIGKVVGLFKSFK